MSKKKNEISLKEFRDKTEKTNTNATFGKKLFGGYNAKQVSEYIDGLAENLHNAEDSFNNRLEEYASMTAMLKQERDQYGEMYNACKNSKIEMVHQIDSLKNENDELNKLLKELTLKENSHEKNSMSNELSAENLELKNKLTEYKDYEQECIRLKDQLDQLKLMVQELNDELKNYAQNEVSDEMSYSLPNENVEKILAENEVIKNQYEDVLEERSILLVENKNLIEQNNNLTDNLIESHEKYKILNEFKDTDVESKQETKQVILDLESKANEYAQNHRSNIDQITNNIKNALNLLDIEKDDLSKLMKHLAPDNSSDSQDDINVKEANATVFF